MGNVQPGGVDDVRWGNPRCFSYVYDDMSLGYERQAIENCILDDNRAPEPQVPSDQLLRLRDTAPAPLCEEYNFRAGPGDGLAEPGGPSDTRILFSSFAEPSERHFYVVTRLPNAEEIFPEFVHQQLLHTLHSLFRSADLCRRCQQHPCCINLRCGHRCCFRCYREMDRCFVCRRDLPRGGTLQQFAELLNVDCDPDPFFRRDGVPGHLFVQRPQSAYSIPRNPYPPPPPPSLQTAVAPSPQNMPPVWRPPPDFMHSLQASGVQNPEHVVQAIGLGSDLDLIRVLGLAQAAAGDQTRTIYQTFEPDTAFAALQAVLQRRGTPPPLRQDLRRLMDLAAIALGTLQDGNLTPREAYSGLFPSDGS